MEIKTHEEQKDSFRDLVLILRAFHTSMSFYGSIGHLMVGSGLQCILELIYAEHTIPTCYQEKHTPGQLEVI